jgi:hypothetical protein
MRKASILENSIQTPIKIYKRKNSLKTDKIKYYKIIQKERKRVTYEYSHMNLSNLIIHDISNLSCLKILNQEEKKKKKANSKTTIYEKQDREVKLSQKQKKQEINRFAIWRAIRTMTLKDPRNLKLDRMFMI